MSNGTKLPYRQVFPLAEKMVERLAPACARIEIAGSLRRKCSFVGDIEIVAQPKFVRPVMGVTPAECWGWSELDHLLADWDKGKKIDILKGDRLRGKKRRYVQFAFASNAGQTYTVDLFIQPDPATWGVNLMIRTGSQEFSRRMVTMRCQGGLMPDELRVNEARVWCGPEAIPTPEERDVFELFGVAWIRPEERN